MLRENTFFKKTILSFFVVFFTLPFFIFLFHISKISIPSDFNFLSVLFLNFLQALLSGLLSFLIAIPLIAGLTSFYRSRLFSFFQFLLLFPALIPSLFVINAFMQFTEFFFTFKPSFYQVVLAHALVNTGLVAVAITELLKKTSLNLLQTSLNLGLSFFTFLKNFLLYEKQRLTQILFFMIFANCFMSLSIPLMLGLPEMSLEYFIYQKLKTSFEWGEVNFLVFLQIAFLFLIGFFIKQDHVNNKEKVFSLFFVDLKKFQWLIFIPITFIIAPLLQGLFYSSLSWLDFSKLFDLSLRTFFVGFFVGVLNFILFYLISFFYYIKDLRKFLLCYVTPSSVILAFSFLLLGGYFFLSVFTKWVLGLTLLSFGAIYRLLGESALQNLNSQLKEAEFWGLSHSMIFKKILWPELLSVAFLIAAISSFWASGEFAYSLIVSEGFQTLSLWVAELMSSYYFQESNVLLFFLLLVASSLFLFFLSLSYYFKQDVSN